MSAGVLQGDRLPYLDNLVNLLVVSDNSGVPEEEMLRVLAPRGVLMREENGQWRKTVKPWPDGIDEWTHFLHDSGGNAVAEDDRVGPPKRLRWTAGPRWCRSHEYPSSVQGVVTGGGRIFTFLDEAPCGVYEKLPQKVSLVARDAFNGVLLWKVPLRGWQPENGTGKGGRWGIHHTIPRRLVVEDDRVYATLTFRDSSVSVLDAATGEVLIEALPGTETADEILLSDRILVAKTLGNPPSITATKAFSQNALPLQGLVAVDVDRGKVLWRHDDIRVLPYGLSAAEGRLVYHNMDELVCLDLRGGEVQWRAPNPIAKTQGGMSTLVIEDGVVLFHGHSTPPGVPDREGNQRRFSAPLRLTALSLEYGKLLWQTKGRKGQAGACTQPTDMFVVDGRVWLDGGTQGLDLRTGQPTRSVSLGKLISPGHHYRCHRSKACENFLIWPKRGAEFVDVTGQGRHMRNDWLRAPCFTGLTPANGLLYVPPSQCFCYPGVKMAGYLAMSADPAEKFHPAGPEALQRGPAYGDIAIQSGNTDPDAWPMYRRDGRRCGSTSTAVPADLTERWTVKFDHECTQPIVVGNRMFTAVKDAHRVVCLNARTGEELWSFTAGGRVDSSPTVVGGAVFFGCRDGAVYCLRADDGEPAWRFRAAPDHRLASYGSLESVWPVNGSVLVRDGVVYFAAGRNTFLDGGIMVYGLDAATGRPLYHHLLEGPWPDVHEDRGSPFAMEGARPDLLVAEGDNLFMGRIKFDPQLNRLPAAERRLGELDMGANHLAPTGGFLDDSGFDRLYWMYSPRWPGFYFAQHAPKAGQILSFDDEATYAVKYFYRRRLWSPQFIPEEHGYLLFADDNDNQPYLQEKDDGVEMLRWLPDESYRDRGRRGGRGTEKGTGYIRVKPARWQKMVPLRIRAMCKAGDTLFAAGYPDKIMPDDPFATFEGRTDGILSAFSTADGTRLMSMKLPLPPAFDGLSAGGGALYLAGENGQLLCLGRP